MEDQTNSDRDDIIYFESEPLPPRGTTPPEPSVPGGYARALHNNLSSTSPGSSRDPLQDPPPLESYTSPMDSSKTVHPLRFGALIPARTLAPASVNQGQSVTNKFPDTLNFLQPEGEKLEIEVGGIKASLQQVANRYFDQFEDDEGHAIQRNQVAHSFILEVGGQKIFIHPPDPNDAVVLNEEGLSIGQPEGMNDQKVVDLITLLDQIPGISRETYNEVVQKAHTAVANTPPFEYPGEKAAKTPIRVHLYGIQHRNPESGAIEDGIVIEPELFGSGSLRWIQDIADKPTEVGEPILPTGGIIFPKDGSNLQNFMGPQLTLEIRGSRVTVVDGDGYGRSSSQNGSEVTLKSNYPTRP